MAHAICRPDRRLVFLLTDHRVLLLTRNEIFGNWQVGDGGRMSVMTAWHLYFHWLFGGVLRPYNNLFFVVFRGQQVASIKLIVIAHVRGTNSLNSFRYTRRSDTRLSEHGRLYIYTDSRLYKYMICRT